MSGGSNAPPLPAGSAPSRTARVRIFPPFVCAPEGGQNARQPTHSRLSTRRSGLSKMSPFILSGYSAVAKHEAIAPLQKPYDVIVESKRYAIHPAWIHILYYSYVGVYRSLLRLTCDCIQMMRLEIKQKENMS